VGDSISEVVRRLGATRTQKSEGEAYRGAQPSVRHPSAVALQQVPVSQLHTCLWTSGP
jgi:hypothetical protein